MIRWLSLCALALIVGASAARAAEPGSPEPPPPAVPTPATPSVKPARLPRRRAIARARPAPANGPLTFGPVAGSGLSVDSFKTAPARPTGPVFTPAPIPDLDVNAPNGPRATADPQLSPGLFSRRPSYRGDAYTPGSTAESDQDRRTRPAAGFRLRLPLRPP